MNSSSLGHELPAISIFFPCANASTRGNSLAVRRMSPTRSKRVSPTIDTLSMPILASKVGKVFQNATKVSSIRTEEYLFGAEDSRDNIRGYIPAFKFVEVVRPKFIFNKYGFRGFGQVE